MASIKYGYCSKVCENSFPMTKHLLIYKMKQKIARRTVLCNILYKINNFSMAKIETMLLLAEPINKKKSLYIDTFDMKDLARIEKRMLDKNETVKMPEIKLIIFESKYIIII